MRSSEMLSWNEAQSIRLLQPPAVLLPSLLSRSNLAAIPPVQILALTLLRTASWTAHPKHSLPDLYILDPRSLPRSRQHNDVLHVIITMYQKLRYLAQNVLLTFYLWLHQFRPS